MTEREIIVALKRLENVERRRKTDNKILYYNCGEKIHVKQLEFHRSPKRNRWVFGGNRSGKTECGAVECVWLARGIHPYRPNRDNVSGWVVSLSSAVQRDVAQAKVLSYLNPKWIKEVVMLSGRSDNPANGIIDFIIVHNVFGGTSRIGFKSCEAGREKFQGASLDFVWFDEEPPKDIYEECRMRVLDRKGDIFGTMTPLLGLTFVYHEIYLNEAGDDNIWHVTMEWADNPFLDSDEVEAATRLLSERELEVRRYGKFASSGGAVYSEFEEGVHVIDGFEVPHEWYSNMSIDPGLNNPLSCHWYAVGTDGEIYVIAEHYEAGKDIAHHARCIIDKCRQLGWPCDERGRYEALIDSAANQRTLAATKSVAELFWEQGIKANTRVVKDVFGGINRVKQYLKDGEGRPRLFVFRQCVHMIREFKSYWWSSGDTPLKKDDHAMDELRYFVMSRPEYSVSTPAKSLIQLDKERLIRRIRRDQRANRL